MHLTSENEEFRRMVALLNDRGRVDALAGSGQRITFDSQGPFGQLVEAKKRERRDRSSDKPTKGARDSSADKGGPKKSAMKLVPKHSGSEMCTTNSAHLRGLDEEASFDRAPKPRRDRRRSARSDSSRDKSSVSKKTSKSRLSAKSRRSRPHSPRSASGSRRIKKKSGEASAARRKRSESPEKPGAVAQASTERGARALRAGPAEAKKKTREALLTELIRFKKPVLPAKKKLPASSLSSDKADKSTELKRPKKKPALDANLSLLERRPLDPANKRGSTKSRRASGPKPPVPKLAASVRSRDRDAVQLSHGSSLLPSKLGSLASDGLQTRKRKSAAVPKSQNR